GVEGNITWLNVRWDTDWPANAELGAGRARGAGPAGAGRGGRGGLAPIEYAPTDRAVYIPKQKMDDYLRDMEAKNLATVRLIEGGHFNVNIRRIKAPSAEQHPRTIDTWVVLEGSGTVNTGFTAKGRERVPGTGVTAPGKVGDLFFVPANVT